MLVFMFQEDNDREVEQVFREIARLTRGAYCRFNPGAVRQLADLRAVKTVPSLSWIETLPSGQKRVFSWIINGLMLKLTISLNRMRMNRHAI